MLQSFIQHNKGYQRVLRIAPISTITEERECLRIQEYTYKKLPVLKNLLQTKLSNHVSSLTVGSSFKQWATATKVLDLRYLRRKRS